MNKRCPLKRPHPAHPWVWENHSPVFGTLRCTFQCPGQDKEEEI